MHRITIVCLVWGLACMQDCSAQNKAVDFAKAFIPAPGEFLPPIFRETEEDRQRLALVEITPREEQQQGRQFLSMYQALLDRQDIDVVERGPEVDYLQALVGQLRPLMDHARRYRRIRVLWADTPRMDARAFPGGTIVFTRGMLDLMESEAALVGTLAHELSHIDRGHQLDGLRRQKLASNTLASGRVSPESFLNAGKLFTHQFLQPFHPEQEEEADADAVRKMMKLGYHPLEMAKLFLRMHELAGGRDQLIPEFLRSHPFHMDRFEAVQAATRQLPRRKLAALYVGRENLRRRVPKSQQEFPE